MILYDGNIGCDGGSADERLISWGNDGGEISSNDDDELFDERRVSIDKRDWDWDWDCDVGDVKLILGEIGFGDEPCNKLSESTGNKGGGNDEQSSSDDGSSNEWRRISLLNPDDNDDDGASGVDDDKSDGFSDNENIFYDNY